MKLKPLFAVSLLILSSACSHYKVSDIGPMVQLPGSKQCFQVYTISHREVIYPPNQCEEIKKRAVYLTSDTWKILRGDVQKNCQLNQCKQLTGAVDSLFLTIDQALQKIP